LAVDSCLVLFFIAMAEPALPGVDSYCRSLPSQADLLSCDTSPESKQRREDEIEGIRSPRNKLWSMAMAALV
jgi:hypothetical protein